MRKVVLTGLFLCFYTLQSNAQLGLMKLVGNGTENYKLGYGAFIKAGFSAFESGDLTIELGFNYFQSKEGDGQATVMCPAKLGYRYMINKTREGFYVEPQLGYNVYGVTSLLDEDGYNVDLKYNGVVLAAGGGYMFLIGSTPFDVNLRYETVIAHGGSNNMVSLGITRYFSFGKKD
jgi:hypothetical protein